MKRYLVIYMLASLCMALAGCKGSEKGAQAPSRYQRKPLVEVSEDQLKRDAEMIEGKTQQMLGNADEALKKYAQLLEQDPGYAAAYYEMGSILLRKGWTDSARVCAEKACALNDTNVWYRMLLATICDRQQDGKGLVKCWETLVKQNPNVLEYYYNLSNAYLTTNNVEGAIEALNRIERRYGVSEPVSLQKQKLWNFIGRADKGRKEIEALAQSLPKEKKYSAILAESYMKEKNYAKAKRYYDQVLETDPDDEYIHISLAEYYRQTGDMQQAYKHLRDGFQNPSLDCRGKMQILAAFYTTEEFYGKYAQQAFELTEVIMSQCGATAEYALFYGDVLMRQGKYAEASDQFKTHLQTDSSRYEVWEALLICLNEQEGKEDEVDATARRASELFPLHPLPYYLQGFNCMMRKEYDQAVEHLSMCESLGFSKGYLQLETYSMLADCLYHSGRADEAWKYFDRCLELKPDDIGTMNNYAYYLALQHTELEKAEQMSRKTIKAEPENATFLDTYAWVLHLMGRSCEALPYMEKAIKNSKEKEGTLPAHMQEISEACRKQ